MHQQKHPKKNFGYKNSQAHCFYATVDSVSIDIYGRVWERAREKVAMAFTIIYEDV